MRALPGRFKTPHTPLKLRLGPLFAGIYLRFVQSLSLRGHIAAIITWHVVCSIASRRLLPLKSKDKSVLALITRTTPDRAFSVPRLLWRDPQWRTEAKEYTRQENIRAHTIGFSTRATCNAEVVPAVAFPGESDHQLTGSVGG